MLKSHLARSGVAASTYASAVSFPDDESLYLYCLFLQRRLGLLKRSVSSIPTPYLRTDHGTYDLRLVKIIELFRPSATKVHMSNVRRTSKFLYL